MQSFNLFLDQFLTAWSSSSLEKLQALISRDYQAREFSRGEILDFGYEESIGGWEQGFQFVNENQAEWQLKTMSTIPLREDETMAVISATLIIDGNPIDTANLFFNTYKSINNEWKLVRSYIEAGVKLP
jgi:hypothetical protein